MFLFINTATEKNQMVLVKDKKILFLREFLGGRDGEIGFYKALKDLKTEHNEDLQKLDQIIVVSGPGSFTALRLGIASANTLAYLLEKKIVELPTADWFRIGQKVQDVVLPAGGHFAHLFQNGEHSVVDIDSIDTNHVYLGELSLNKKPEDLKFEDQISIEEKFEIFDTAIYKITDQASPWYGKSPV